VRMPVWAVFATVAVTELYVKVTNNPALYVGTQTPRYSLRYIGF